MTLLLGTAHDSAASASRGGVTTAESGPAGRAESEPACHQDAWPGREHFTVWEAPTSSCGVFPSWDALTRRLASMEDFSGEAKSSARRV